MIIGNKPGVVLQLCAPCLLQAGKIQGGHMGSKSGIRG